MSRPQTVSIVHGSGSHARIDQQLEDYAISGATAGFKIALEAVEMGKERGLMVLKHAGEVVEVDAGTPHGF